MRGQNYNGPRHRKSASDTFAFTGEDWQTMLQPLDEKDKQDSAGDDYVPQHLTASAAGDTEQAMSARQRAASTSTRIKLEPKPRSSTKSNALDPSQLDPKRAKRILANRQSAARSRMKRLQHMHELDQQVEQLRRQHDHLQEELQQEEQRQEQLRSQCLSTERQLRSQQQELARQQELRQSWQQELARLRAAVDRQRGSGSSQLPDARQAQLPWQQHPQQAVPQQHAASQPHAGLPQQAALQQQAQQQLHWQHAPAEPAATPMHIDSTSRAPTQSVQQRLHQPRDQRQHTWPHALTSCPAPAQQQQQQQQGLATWPASALDPDELGCGMHPSAHSTQAATSQDKALPLSPLPPLQQQHHQHHHMHQHQHHHHHHQQYEPQRASSDPLGLAHPSSSSSPSRPSSLAAASPTPTVEVHSDLSDEKDLLARQLGLKASPLLLPASPGPDLHLDMDMDLLLGDSPLFNL